MKKGENTTHCCLDCILNVFHMQQKSLCTQNVIPNLIFLHSTWYGLIMLITKQAAYFLVYILSALGKLNWCIKRAQHRNVRRYRLQYFCAAGGTRTLISFVNNHVNMASLPYLLHFHNVESQLHIKAISIVCIMY